jgi:hypothetical protein
MKQFLTGALCFVIACAAIGCGGGISEGQPESTKPGVPIEPPSMKPIKGPLPKGSATGAVETEKK